MAKYKAYPEYKDSGVEWLGKVPKDWIIINIKYLSQVKRGASPRPIDDPKFFDEDGDYAWVRIADVTASDTYLLETTQKMSVLGSSLSVRLEPNQLFLSIAGTVGKPCITAIKSCIHDGFVYFPYLKISNKFLFYVFAGEQAYKGLGKMGTQLNLNTDTVGGIKVALPSNNDFITNIVSFLAHETAKIDNLIEKQQQLIELLKEKRQAVISYAVTKGLNPDVPMKDSGVEWLGEVPEHWGVTTLRNLIRGESVVIQDGNHGELHPVAAEYVRDGIPFLMANNIRDRKVDLIECKRITKNRADKLRIGFAKAGDMLLTHKGTVGEVATIPEYIAESYWMLTPQVTYYRWANKKFDARFCTYLFQSKSIQTQLEIIGSKQSTRAYVGLIAQGELIVVIPPLGEQQAIREELDRVISRFDEILAKADNSIELMQERRTALISAAVTGKIDVRDWVEPNACEAEVSQEVTA